MSKKDNEIKYKDEHFILSAKLLNKNDAWDNLETIIKLHKQRIDLFEEAKLITEQIKLSKVKKSRLKEIVLEVENIEFSLQRAWKFKVDRNFHNYWYRIPGCTCPKADNQDYFGTEYRMINEKCPFHGGLTKQ